MSIALEKWCEENTYRHGPGEIWRLLLLVLGSSGHVVPMTEGAETDGADFVVLGERGVYEVLVTEEDVYDVLDDDFLGVESMSLSFHW
jgi:hypothetical protein